MGLFDKLFGRKKPVAPSAGELARERLTLMLVHDRLKLTPDLLDRIKEELLAVISKYVEIDETGVDVELTHSEHSDKLVARMPVRRQRLQFQRDVLEPGMGNPLAAAAALAAIHQPPADAPAEVPPATVPTEAVSEAARPPAEGASPEPASASPATAEATPASEESQTETKESEPAKAETAARASAQDNAEPAGAASAAETAPADATPVEDAVPEASSPPAQAANEAPVPEVPASAPTPTKG